MLPRGPLTLKGRALRLLGAREHSRAELVRRLAPFEEQPGQLAAVLDDLQAKGFISEQRVAESLAWRRGARLGTARVVQEMQARGVASDAIADAAAQLRVTELERATAVWVRKFGAAPADAVERARQTRFLMGRGFSADTASRVLRASHDNAAQDTEAPQPTPAP